MDICGNDESMAKSSCLFQEVKPKNVVIQCQVPRIGEVFQMSHLRSSLLCNFITNVKQVSGHNVAKTAHFADWGLFSALVTTGFKQLGVTSDLLKSPSLHLSEVTKASKVLFNNDDKFQKKVETCLEKLKSGEEDYLLDWKYVKSLCLEEYNSLYKRIGLKFDDTHFDSSYSSEIEKIQNDLLCTKFISIQNDGSLKINFPLQKTEIALGKQSIDGPLYSLSRGIFSMIMKKEKFNFDELLYIAPSSEDTYVTVLKNLLVEMGHDWSRNIHHVKVQKLYSFGKAGTKHDAESLLNYAKLNMLKKLKFDMGLQADPNIEEMAEVLGFSSLCINDLKHKRSVDYRFNWDEVLSLGRNSGSSLQLCHAGLKGLHADSEYKFNVETDTSPLSEREANNLIRHLSRFDEVVYESCTTLEPCYIVQYLFLLWYLTNKATDVLNLDIKENRMVVLKARLMLLESSLKVLQKGLHLLGITPFTTDYTPPDMFKDVE